MTYWLIAAAVLFLTRSSSFQILLHYISKIAWCSEIRQQKPLWEMQPHICSMYHYYTYTHIYKNFHIILTQFYWKEITAYDRIGMSCEGWTEVYDLTSTTLQWKCQWIPFKLILNTINLTKKLYSYKCRIQFCTSNLSASLTDVSEFSHIPGSQILVRKT